MEPDVKLRMLAQREPTLTAALGAGPFRWQRKPLTMGYLPKKRGDIAPGGGTSSVEVKIISRVSQYTHTEGAVTWEWVRFQLDILDLDDGVAASVATSVAAFLGRVNLITGQLFGSPITTPNNFPTFIGNRRQGEKTEPGPLVYVESLDVVLLNDTSF